MFTGTLTSGSRWSSSCRLVRAVPSDMEGRPVASSWVLGKSLRGIFVLLGININVILQSSTAHRSHHPLGCGLSLFVWCWSWWPWADWTARCCPRLVSYCRFGMSTTLQSLLVLGKFLYATFSADTVTDFGLLLSVNNSIQIHRGLWNPFTQAHKEGTSVGHSVFLFGSEWSRRTMEAVLTASFCNFFLNYS